MIPLSLLSALSSLALPPAPFGLLMGLCAATAWGLSDFCLRGVGRSGASPLRSLSGIFLAATLGLSGALPFTGAFAHLARCPLPVLGLAALLGLLLVLANLLLYRALAHGPVSLVAPIANSHAAVTVLLTLLAGQRPTLPTLGALTLIGVGVALASLPSTHAQPGAMPRHRNALRWTPGLLTPPGTTIAITRMHLAVVVACPPACPPAPVRARVGVNTRGMGTLSARSDLWSCQWLSPPLVSRLIRVDSAPLVGPVPPRAFPTALAQCLSAHAIGAMGGLTPAALQPTRRRVRPGLPPGIGEALGSAVLLGTVFWAMRFVAPMLGPTATAWMLRADSTILLWGWMGAGAVLNARWASGHREHAWRKLRLLVLRDPGWTSAARRSPQATAVSGDARSRRRAEWREAGAGGAAGEPHAPWRHVGLVAAVGLLDALATLAYSLGVSATSPLFVAPPATLSAVLTATLGCMVLGEELGGRRLGGVILALGGMILLSPMVG